MSTGLKKTSVCASLIQSTTMTEAEKFIHENLTVSPSELPMGISSDVSYKVNRAMQQPPRTHTVGKMKGKTRATAKVFRDFLFVSALFSLVFTLKSGRRLPVSTRFVLFGKKK